MFWVSVMFRVIYMVKDIYMFRVMFLFKSIYMFIVSNMCKYLVC